MLSHLRDHPSGLHLGLMLALTFSTGVVDAVGYLGLDRVFTGNMTGNVVILAMAIADPSSKLPVIGPIVALACFLIGAAIAGRVLRGLEAGWHVRTTVLFSCVAALLATATILAFLVPERPEPLSFAITGAMGLAMGIQAGSARHIGVADVTTVVVTSTLVGIAFDSRFGGGKDKHPWPRRAGAILLIGAGAAAGALLLHLGSIGDGLLLAAVITVVVVVLGALGRPHPVDGDPSN
ncbi:YoaK family protein [soil metagenome]